VLVGIVSPPALTVLMLAVTGRARYAAGTKTGMRNWRMKLMAVQGTVGRLGAAKYR
jgi:hypothetical protein